MKTQYSKLVEVITESIKKVIKENFESEDVPTYEAIRDEDRSLFDAYVYDANDRCVGRLRDLHFKYDPSRDCLFGEREM